MSLSVISDDPAIVQRAMETFARAATGLALEGAEVVVLAGTEDEDADELAEG